MPYYLLYIDIVYYIFILFTVYPYYGNLRESQRAKNGPEALPPAPPSSAAGDRQLSDSPSPAGLGILVGEVWVDATHILVSLGPEGYIARLVASHGICLGCRSLAEASKAPSLLVLQTCKLGLGLPPGWLASHSILWH